MIFDPEAFLTGLGPAVLSSRLRRAEAGLRSRFLTELKSLGPGFANAIRLVRGQVGQRRRRLPHELPCLPLGAFVLLSVRKLIIELGIRLVIVGLQTASFGEEYSSHVKGAPFRIQREPDYPLTAIMTKS